MEMTQEQLIQAMAYEGYALDVHYTIAEDYESIQMIPQQAEEGGELILEKPSMEKLLNNLAELARIAQEEALAAKQARIEALGDISLLVSEYLKDKQELIDVDQDSWNIAGFEVSRIDSSFGWDFKNIPKPTLEELEALKDPMETAMLQASRNAKLQRLRELREPLLKEVDVMVNDLVLEVRTDKAEVLAYREALKVFTDPYRWANDPNRAKVAIDSLDLDNIQWPVKPE